MANKLNAIQCHEEICKWIATSERETQLNVITLFITDTFSKRFPNETNPLHCQFVDNMLLKIEQKFNEIGRCENVDIYSIKNHPNND